MATRWRQWLVALLAIALIAAAVLLRNRHSGGNRPVPVTAHIVLSPGTVRLGGTYRITGSGFSASERVQLFWTDRDVAPAAAPVMLGATTADHEGRLRPLVVREGAVPARYVILARGLQSGRTASSPLTVIAPGPG